MTVWPAKEEMRAAGVIGGVVGVPLLVAGFVVGIEVVWFAATASRGPCRSP